jgi:periplasmic divalent cation tolerance protein
MAEAGPNTDIRLALSTAPDLETAERLIRTLVDERIIACGSIVPGLVSIYHWQGQVRRDAEVLIILKTAEINVARLTQRVPELHPYEVPELLLLPVVDGHPAYLDWVRSTANARRAESP